ncbi:MAG: hypothetical protein Kow0099_09580 [Candidatus Abyssubacteria bacterium]
MDRRELERRKFLKLTASGSILSVLGLPLFSVACGGARELPYPEHGTNSVGKSSEFSGKPPNIIIINADDLGYGDLGCYGSQAIKTPHIDRLADQGVRFTNFYACDSVCTPSRAGLLTGRYPIRMGFCYPIYAEDMTLKQAVLMKMGNLITKLGTLDYATEEGPGGLHHQEITIAEALKVGDYRTGMVGKWHLGDYSTNPEYNPVRHGFDFYFGVPHSNDMYPFPLYRNEQQLESHITDQTKLTRLYTEEAIKFIESSADRPFFLYFAHTFPHRPLFASEPFAGRSEGGTFGDTVEEIDWSVSEILNCLEKHDLVENTMVMFTSDNGPWYQGSAGGLRGRKGQSWEGGQRVPFIVRWPAHIAPGGMCKEPCMNIDLLPTCISVAGLTPPTDRIIDGMNIRELLISPTHSLPDRPLFFYHIGELESVRSGQWKYVRSVSHYTWPMPVNKAWGKMSEHTEGPLPLLFNLESDPGESYNLLNKYPAKGEELEKTMSEWEKEMEANPLGLIQ